MMLGVEVTGKNSRCHEVLDLATNPDIIALIKAHKNAHKCHATGEVNLKLFVLKIDFWVFILWN